MIKFIAPSSKANRACLLTDFAREVGAFVIRYSKNIAFWTAFPLFDELKIVVFAVIIGMFCHAAFATKDFLAFIAFECLCTHIDYTFAAAYKANSFVSCSEFFIFLDLIYIGLEKILYKTVFPVRIDLFIAVGALHLHACGYAVAGIAV